MAVVAPAFPTTRRFSSWWCSDSFRGTSAALLAIIGLLVVLAWRVLPDAFGEFPWFAFEPPDRSELHVVEHDVAEFRARSQLLQVVVVQREPYRVVLREFDATLRLEAVGPLEVSDEVDLQLRERPVGDAVEVVLRAVALSESAQ